MAAQLAKDFRSAPIDAGDVALLTYVEKLTQTPSKMIKSDVQALRDQGFSDSAILDICQVAGYYAFVNRLADGLGVELEASSDEVA